MKEMPKRGLFSSLRGKLNGLIKKVTGRNADVVYFVSFPKSGRTWLQLMLARVYAELTGMNVELFLDSNKELVKDKVQPYPFLHVGHGYKNSSIAQGDDFPVDYYKGKKVILMIRDPRDVVVSHYYHEKYHYKCFDGTISEFIRYQYDENQPDPGRRKARFGILPILNYMNAWQKNLGILEGSYLLTYEDMKMDTFCYFYEVCKFIGLPVKKEFLHEVIEACSFDNMRKLEEKKGLKWNGLESSDTKLGFKTRKGKTGGYKEELSDEDISYLDKIILNTLDPAFSRYIQ